MISPNSLEFKIENQIAQIVLNRPEAYNALTFDVYRELTQLFHDLKDEESVKVAIITGKGKAFCSGGDVREIIGHLQGKTDVELRAFTRMTCDLIWNMRCWNRPIVACLNGIAAGAGAMIALASDFRIAADSARIAFLFVQVGLSGADMGACYLLPKVIGLSKATELLMTGNFITAEEAQRIGLYHYVVSTEQVWNAAMQFAAKLAAGPSNGIAVTKQQLNEECLPRLRDVLEREAEMQAHCMLDPDFKEGYTAFLEKRKPKFV